MTLESSTRGPHLAYAIVVAVAFFLANLIGLDRSPTVWQDEVTLNDPARQFVQTGEFRSRVFSDVPGFEHGYLWQPPAHTCVAIAAYRIFGFGIWQTRIPPLLFGAGSVFLVYCVTWRISRNTRAAVLASLLWALQPGFIQMVRSGRMDAQCIFFVVLSTLLAIRAIQSFSSLIGYAVAGLAGGIGITTHPIALFWAAGIGLMLLAARRGKWLPAIAFAVGAALPVAGWLGYASERLDVFRAQFLNHAGHMVASGTVATRTVAEISKYFITYPLVLPEFLVLLGSLAYFGFQSRVSAQIRFGMMAIVALLFLPGPVFKLNVSVFRFMHPVVIFCITGGMMLSDLIERSSTRSRPWLKNAAILLAGLTIANVLVVGLLARYLVLFLQWRERDYRQVDRAVAVYVKPGMVVAADPQLWYAIERCGGLQESLNVEAPDPARFLYVIRAVKPERSSAPFGYVKVGHFGKPFSPVFNKKLTTEDYDMDVFRSTLMP